ncbi:MAG: toll/interleukin-1 receptor domain-containing protein [Candidatus Limnocylindrales bacterium]
MTTRDLFISHSSGDAEVARALRTVLEEAGYTCWMAPDDIVGTGAWTEQILGAIADSKAMLILVSAASNKSQHVSREVNLALGKGRPVLPIRIEDVAPGGSLEYLLSLVQRVDAFPPPVTVHRDRILRRLDTIVERPISIASETPIAAPIAAPIAPPIAATPLLPPPAIDLTARDVLPGMTVSRTHVSMPGLTVERGADSGAIRRSGPPMALLVGGGAVALVLAAVVGSQLLGPGASPKPTGAAVSTESAGTATAAPTEAQPSTAATASPLSASELLLQSVLPRVAGVDACTSWPTPPGGDDVLSPSGYAGSTARLSCPGPSAGPATEYALYPTKAALDADYNSIMTGQGVAAGGACLTAIPANAAWNFPSYPESGKLACFERDGRVQYVWTQNELRVLGQWLAPDNATGLAFWTGWTTTMNPAELDLLADLPASADELGACVRAADRYYVEAIAIVGCPRPAGQNSVFYARFESAATFPNDAMTANFDSIMTSGGFADDTTAACYDAEPVFGRYTWGYNDNGEIGATEGYLGCYERTDSTPATAQYVWTLNRTATMGVWAAPDLQTGIDFFDDWIGEVR